MALSNTLLIITIFSAILCVDALLGRAFLFGLVLRSLLRAFKACAPGAAQRLGIGDEVVEGLKASAGAAAFIGRVCEVEVAIENGCGRINIDGVSWTAVGPDSPMGTPVRILMVDGNRVTIERLVAED